MAEDLNIVLGAKNDQYRSLIPQISALLSGETDEIANMANVCAALGPFQGPVACSRIQKGKGVCGSSWNQEKILIVPDVDAFPGHIACSSASKSEIVIPIIRNGLVIGVLDVDSDELNSFDQSDAVNLSTIIELITFKS